MVLLSRYRKKLRRKRRRSLNHSSEATSRETKETRAIVSRPAEVLHVRATSRIASAASKESLQRQKAGMLRPKSRVSNLATRKILTSRENSRTNRNGRASKTVLTVVDVATPDRIEHLLQKTVRAVRRVK